MWFRYSNNARVSRERESKLFGKKFNQKVKLLEKVSSKTQAQSAMEYLMTYGWAILIIAIVLGALFSLGVFSSSNFTPRARPGSCQVFRSVVATNLEGLCSGELPEYVAQINNKSYVNVSSAPSFAPEALTVVVWVKPAILSYPCCARSKITGDNLGGNNDFYVDVNSSGYFNAYIYTVISGAGSWKVINSNGIVVTPNTWYFVAETYNGVTQNIYVNGAYNNGGGCACEDLPSPQGLMGIGDGIGKGSPFAGSIANLQLYNTTLSAAEISALYQEGIGGAPIDVNNIIGWWPLNGDTNDYSGNGNDGTATNVIYTSAWTSGYSAP